jgi:hypothetical protein
MRNAARRIVATNIPGAGQVKNESQQPSRFKRVIQVFLLLIIGVPSILIGGSQFVSLHTGLREQADVIIYDSGMWILFAAGLSLLAIAANRALPDLIVGPQSAVGKTLLVILALVMIFFFQFIPSHFYIEHLKGKGYEVCEVERSRHAERSNWIRTGCSGGRA